MRIKSDKTGITGYAADAKSPANRKGFCCEIVVESNKYLRVYTDGNYRYLTSWQARQLLKRLNKMIGIKPTPTKHKRKE